MTTPSKMRKEYPGHCVTKSTLWTPKGGRIDTLAHHEPMLGKLLAGLLGLTGPRTDDEEFAMTRLGEVIRGEPLSATMDSVREGVREYELQRAQELRADAIEVCERRTAERDRSRAILAGQVEEAAVGRAMLDLVAQIKRLRENPCETMRHGISPGHLLDAMRDELDELEAEEPCSPRAQSEAVDVFTIGLHVAISEDLDVYEALQVAAAKLEGRNDVVARGGTWTEAKLLEST